MSRFNRRIKLALGFPEPHISQEFEHLTDEELEEMFKGRLENKHKAVHLNSCTGCGSRMWEKWYQPEAVKMIEEHKRFLSDEAQDREQHKFPFYDEVRSEQTKQILDVGG